MKWSCKAHTHASLPVHMYMSTHLGDLVCDSCVRTTLCYVQQSSFPAEAAFFPSSTCKLGHPVEVLTFQF